MRTYFKNNKDYSLSEIEKTHYKYVYKKTGELRLATKTDIISTMGIDCFVYFPIDDPVNIKIQNGESINVSERQNEVIYGLYYFRESPIFIERNAQECMIV